MLLIPILDSSRKHWLLAVLDKLSSTLYIVNPNPNAITQSQK